LAEMDKGFLGSALAVFEWEHSQYGVGHITVWGVNPLFLGREVGGHTHGCSSVTPEHLLPHYHLVFYIPVGLATF